MQVQRPESLPAAAIIGALLAVAGVWLLLALLCWLYPAALIRFALALFTGVVLLAGFAWYCTASWAWRRGGAGLERFPKPATVLVFGWALCLGSCLASTFALRSVGQPAPPVPTIKVQPTAPTGSTEPAKGKLFANGPRRFLADMEEFDVKAGPWPFRKDGKLKEDAAILVQGKLSVKGLSMHPPDNGYSSVKYRLNDEAAVFKGKAAIDDTGRPFFAPASFEVLGDGVSLWKSKRFTQPKEAPDECNVSVVKVRTLELRCYSESFSTYIHSVWVEPRVLQKADTPDGP